MTTPRVPCNKKLHLINRSYLISDLFTKVSSKAMCFPDTSATACNNVAMCDSPSGTAVVKFTLLFALPRTRPSHNCSGASFRINTSETFITSQVDIRDASRLVDSLKKSHKLLFSVYYLENCSLRKK